MQLEEFKRAVRSSYVKSSGDDARDRHHDFMVAIEDQVSKIENSLKESALSEGKTSLPWVRLDEGECNELASFLSGPTKSSKNIVKDHRRETQKTEEMGKESLPDCLKNLSHSVHCASLDHREVKSHGHRRTASASADIGAWKIAIPEDGCQHNPSNEQAPAPRPPRKVPSLAGILTSMESVTKVDWPKNSVRKWKTVDRHQESETIPLQSSQLTSVSVLLFYLIFLIGIYFLILSLCWWCH